MRNKKNYGGGFISAADAAHRAAVPLSKVKELARRRVIFAQIRGDRIWVSPAVVDELPALVSIHFTDSGEFVHNPPVVAEYRHTGIDEYQNQKHREVY